jgi:hypothetical protein
LSIRRANKSETTVFEHAFDRPYRHAAPPLVGWSGTARIGQTSTANYLLTRWNGLAPAAGIVNTITE